MHFYWRIIEELKSMGESWAISDPALKRNYQRWIQSNAEAIMMSTGGDENSTAIPSSLMRNNTHDLN